MNAVPSEHFGASCYEDAAPTIQAHANTGPVKAQLAEGAKPIIQEDAAYLYGIANQSVPGRVVNRCSGEQ